jgi:hypothetical protein
MRNLSLENDLAGLREYFDQLIALQQLEDLAPDTPEFLEELGLWDQTAKHALYELKRLLTDYATELEAEATTAQDVLNSESFSYLGRTIRDGSSKPLEPVRKVMEFPYKTDSGREIEACKKRISKIIMGGVRKDWQAYAYFETYHALISQTIQGIEQKLFAAFPDLAADDGPELRHRSILAAANFLEEAEELLWPKPAHRWFLFPFLLVLYGIIILNINIKLRFKKLFGR